MAAAVGDPSIVLQLLEAGASVTAADEMGATPLIMAAFRGHTEVG
jgi:ankyrin repeat protein